MSLVDSSPPPLRYQRSGVNWIILPFLAAGVSAMRAFSRTPSLLELSPPMARVRLMTKRMSGLISLTLSKLTSSLSSTVPLPSVGTTLATMVS